MAKICWYSLVWLSSRARRGQRNLCAYKREKGPQIGFCEPLLILEGA